eukprot:scaffold59465_cov63-Phaeocystis_antarctica.AAC.4
MAPNYYILNTECAKRAWAGGSFAGVRGEGRGYINRRCSCRRDFQLSHLRCFASPADARSR